MQSDTGGPFESRSIPDSYRTHLQPVIFEPWAARLVAFVGLEAGQTVLDVASGTGAVARAAAGAVGSSGRVIASDISTGMLSHVQLGADPDGAAIEVLESPATAIALPDDTVDVALCQQGFPFIPDRVAAAREMRRVLRPGGTIGVAVWAAGRRLEPFDSYGEVLVAAGFDTPFIRGSASGAMSMSEAEMREVLSAAGFIDVDVAVQELELEWPSGEEAAAGIGGTPYWPIVESLEPGRRNDVLSALRRALTGEKGRPLRQTTFAVLGRGTVGR
ncbi:class I SAM-dependent methyltransferase [Parafrigoribacterium soli]|uniref:class I SAM-dependent methyltransferase n=1 Tax=Parafrigoribacterium soli TaxID=3144663 RepID=UPI0032EDF8F6